MRLDFGDLSPGRSFRTFPMDALFSFLLPSAPWSYFSSHPPHPKVILSWKMCVSLSTLRNQRRTKMVLSWVVSIQRWKMEAFIEPCSQTSNLTNFRTKANEYNLAISLRDLNVHGGDSHLQGEFISELRTISGLRWRPPPKKADCGPSGRIYIRNQGLNEQLNPGA